ncbi:LexA family protein [Acidovorax sp. RAC01]|uniref:LexA family protein n=1 Tax=Acidovorax sp. RAC01 TaxID=1842533 RepID=UPI00083E8175|nr:XRE family transcriptional regulator [Acidovorax sp. RAC01]AOG21647.1 peptidase S24-like family protein [Acidovorax sp. RAC01]AOG23203.1 peptidase S24-like family protein [Acidovorax sp. RAC01]
MSYGQRLKEALDHSGRGRKELAEAIGRSVQAVGDVLNGKSKAFTAENNAKAAEFLKVDSFWLATGNGEMKAVPQSNVTPAPIGARSVPVISAIQAGMWCEIVDQFQPGDADEYLMTDLELSAHAFALTIRGDSMLPEFNAGDRVIIDPDVAPHPGDFVAAKNGEQEATFKKYRPRGMDASGNLVFELVPLNDDYPTLRSDIEPIRIVGTMVEHRKYRRPR